MDKKLEIQLPSLRYINAVNVDMDNKIVLGNQKAEINEYNIRNVLSATEVFDAEREASEIYRIYGRMEWASILNGITLNYHTLPHFFLPYRYSNPQSVPNKFDFFLVRPYTGYTKINSSANNQYIRQFQIIAVPDEIDIYPAAFARNVYNDPSYIFNINTDIDISDYYDDFGFPVTELYLFAQYKKRVGDSTHKAEFVEYYKWNTSGLVTTPEFNTNQNLQKGDILTTDDGNTISDVVIYTKDEFKQEQNQNQKQIFRITTWYGGTTIPEQTNVLRWTYEPFIPIRIRYLSDSLYKMNTGSTAYNNVQSIPSYATKTDNDGNYVWRTIQPDGYIDPLTGKGTDNPFINGKRYLFSPLILDTKPDLQHANTNSVFNEINFENNATVLDKIPVNKDIDEIGKPCK